jgi:hypothetical protein
LKKRTIILSGIIILLALVLGAVVYAQVYSTEKTEDGFVYSVWSEKITIRGYEGENSILEIPQTIEVDGKEVIVEKIGRGAFSENETIERVIIEDNILAIESSAFSDCVNLERLEFLGDAPKMGKNIFKGCSQDLLLLYLDGKTGYEEDTFGYLAEPFFGVEYIDSGSENGIVPKDDGRYKNGDQVIALQNTGNLEKEGHTFTGWNTSKDGTGEFIEEGQAFEVKSENIQLHPNWVINKYDIIFNSNGGDKLESIEVEWNNKIPKPKGIEKKDHIFVNWYKDENFKEEWDFEKNLVTEDINIYAKWIAIPKAPQGLSAKTGGYDQIDLSWKGINGVTGYEVHRSESSDGEYKKVADVESTSYKDKGRTYDKTYYYKVKAYTIDGEAEAYGDLSGSSSAKAMLLTPNNFTAKRQQSNKMEVSWNTSVGATGYEIYKASSASGNFEYLANTNKTSYTDTKGAWSKGNYYKVRSYRKSGDKNVYSEFTSVKGYAGVGSAAANYLSSQANRRSIAQRAMSLNRGSTSNACVYFQSEVLRRVGVNVPNTMRNIDYLLPFLYDNGWVKERDYTKLRVGDICFTTDDKGDKNGRPTHAYTFMGWVEEGSYDYAYVFDNQSITYEKKLIHARNFLEKGEIYGETKDAFSYFLYNR